jgi:hypothetical protein
MAAPFSTPLDCTICDLPVSLEENETDANGSAVHEDCYLNDKIEAKSTDSHQFT